MKFDITNASLVQTDLPENGCCIIFSTQIKYSRRIHSNIRKFTRLTVQNLCNSEKEGVYENYVYN